MKAHIYLFFNGNCTEALTFYMDVLGGDDLSLMRYKDYPGGANQNPALDDKIIHGRLTFGGNTIMASDSPPEMYGTPQGFSISLTVDTPEEADSLYSKLTDSGKITMPISETPFAHRFGMFSDKFGTEWMISCEKATM
jgi:PhnB protein